MIGQPKIEILFQTLRCAKELHLVFIAVMLQTLVVNEWSGIRLCHRAVNKAIGHVMNMWYVLPSLLNMYLGYNIQPKLACFSYSLV